jgi:tetratricopeptide (TPR) repeat protein
LSFGLSMRSSPPGPRSPWASCCSWTAASGREDCAPEAAFYLGLAHYDAGETGKAAGHWERAVASEHPGAAPVAALNLGVLHHTEGRLEQAVDAWQVAIDSGHDIYGPEAERMLRLATQTGD